MFVLGVTGGIGSGKSEVTGYFLDHPDEKKRAALHTLRSSVLSGKISYAKTGLWIAKNWQLLSLTILNSLKHWMTSFTRLSKTTFRVRW